MRRGPLSGRHDLCERYLRSAYGLLFLLSSLRLRFLLRFHRHVSALRHVPSARRLCERPGVHSSHVRRDVHVRRATVRISMHAGINVETLKEATSRHSIDVPSLPGALVLFSLSFSVSAHTNASSRTLVNRSIRVACLPDVKSHAFRASPSLSSSCLRLTAVVHLISSFDSHPDAKATRMCTRTHAEPVAS